MKGQLWLAPITGSERFDAARNIIFEGSNLPFDEATLQAEQISCRDVMSTCCELVGIQHNLKGGIERIGKSLFEFGAGFDGQRFANDHRCQLPRYQTLLP